MKAIQVRAFGGPEVMKLEDAKEPSAGPGQLLIRVKAAGVNPVDTTFRSGNHPLAKSLKLPWTPGGDAAGEVEAVGAGLEGFKAGDRVFGSATSGSYAEMALMSPTRTAQLPPGMGFEEGASFPIVLYTAYYGLIYKAAIRTGETVLIHAGAGGVGGMAIQIAKASGCRVISTGSSREKLDFCKKLGADVAINYREEDFAARCLSETGGRGVDAVLEMVASENFDKDCQALRRAGRMVVLGSGTGKSPTGTITYPPFYSKDIDVRGMSLFNAESVFPDMIRQVGLLLREGKVKACVGQVMPLAEAAESHKVLMTGKVLGKIVLKV